ncbi:MAG: hypothetical protein P1U34_09550 [Coxiellaceae bacterium]|nr:hypothetical protein [Coxiellaceae bacterium]
MRMSYRDRLEKAEATEFQDEYLDLINDYKASVEADADANAKKQYHDDILYALDLVSKLGDNGACCDLYHQLIYDFNQIAEARAIYVKAKAAYIVSINAMIAGKNWLDASNHLRLVLENCEAADSIDAAACFSVITMNTSDPQYPRYVAEYYVSQNRYDMAQVYWRLSHSKLTSDHSPQQRTDISLGLAKTSDAVGDTEIAKVAWRLVVIYLRNLLLVEEQMVYLDQVLACDDSEARKMAVAQLQLIGIGSKLNQVAYEKLGDYCSTRPAEGDAYEYYRIAARQGSETAFDKAYPGVSLVRCYQLAKDEDNAVAFIKLKNACDSGQVAYRKSVGRCYLHGYGVNASEHKAAEYGVFALRSTRRRLSIQQTIFWHDGSYPKKLNRELKYIVQAIGGDDLTYLLHGNKVKINGIKEYYAMNNSSKSLKAFLGAVNSPLAKEVLDGFYETYIYNFKFIVDGNWDAPTIADLNQRIDDGKMVYLSINICNHAVSISFKKIDGVLYMIYNNHGQTTRKEGGVDASGHTVFRVDHPDALNDPAVLAHLTFGRSKLSFFEDFSAEGAGFGKLLQLKPLAHIPRSQQKRGNCSMKVSYNAFHNQLLFHYAAAAENRLPEGGINWLAAHEQSMPMYKFWRWMTRKYCLEYLIQMRELDSELQLPADEHFTFVEPIIGYVHRKFHGANFAKKTLLMIIKNFLKSSGCDYLPAQKAELITKIDGCLADCAGSESESMPVMTPA